MAITFNGYDVSCITMEVDSNSDLSVGDFVSLDSNQKLSKCTNAPFIGIIIGKRDTAITVQTRGYVEVEISGTTKPTTFTNLVASGAKVSVQATDNTAVNVPRKVLKYNSTQKAIGFLI